MAVNPIPYSRRDPIMPAGSRDYKIPNPESRDGENRYGIAIPSYSSISVAFRDIDKEVKITWNRLTKYFWLCSERNTTGTSQAKVGYEFVIGIVVKFEEIKTKFITV